MVLPSNDPNTYLYRAIARVGTFKPATKKLFTNGNAITGLPSLVYCCPENLTYAKIIQFIVYFAAADPRF